MDELYYIKKRKAKLTGVFQRLIALLIVGSFLAEGTEFFVLTAAAADTGKQFSCGDYSITYDVTDEWENHQNITVTVSNPTDEPLYNWAIQYDAGGMISGIWNG